MKNITTVILAAGRSTRFISSKSKLTHDLAGLPILSHVYNTAKKISGKNVVVVCNKNNHDELNSILNGCKLVIQKYQKGTADAIEAARPYIKTELLMDGITKNIELTLADRASMDYTMLIGRKALGRRWMVKPSNSFLTKPNKKNGKK